VLRLYLDYVFSYFILCDGFIYFRQTLIITLILILTLYYQLADFLGHDESIVMVTYLHTVITINEMYYVIVIVEFIVIVIVIVIVDDCYFKALLHIIIDMSLN